MLDAPFALSASGSSVLGDVGLSGGVGGPHGQQLSPYELSDEQLRQLLLMCRDSSRVRTEAGVALEAIGRDFEGADRAFGSLKGGLLPENVVQVARIHLNGLIAYQSELGAALAIANRDGEEARREERLRIWGYA